MSRRTEQTGQKREANSQKEVRYQKSQTKLKEEKRVKLLL